MRPARNVEVWGREGGSSSSALVSYHCMRGVWLGVRSGDVPHVLGLRECRGDSCCFVVVGFVGIVLGLGVEKEDGVGGMS